jgi:hypothetical protein
MTEDFDIENQNLRGKGGGTRSKPPLFGSGSA